MAYQIDAINSFPPTDTIMVHKLMGIYMGSLILGIIPGTLVHGFCFF